MIPCRKCGYAVSEFDVSCPQCAAPRAVYSPPEGFTAVAGETSYYRLEQMAGPDGRLQVRAVAFDPVSGEYTAVSAPPQALMPTAPAPFTYAAVPQTGAPAPFAGGAPPGLQPFAAPPITNRPLPYSVRGTGYVSLLGFLGWLVAVAGPIIGMVRAVTGFRVLIEGLVSGTITDVTDGLLENFDISPGDFSGVLSIWDLVKELPGGITGLLLGFAVFLFALIPFFVMMASLRTNYRAGRVLVILNFVLCALGGWLCHSVFGRIGGLLSGLPEPYGNISQTVLIFVAVSAALWFIAAALYFILSAKSKRQNSLSSF